MIDELRKFNRTPTSLLIYVFAIACSMLVPLFFIFTSVNYNYSTGEEIEKLGLEGIEDRKDDLEKVRGEITVSKLNSALNLYKSFENTSDGFYAIEGAYPDFYFLLYEAYAPYAEEEMVSFTLGEVASADDFYNRPVNKIKSKINAFGRQNLNEDEIEFMLSKAENLSKPYQFEYNDQYAYLIQSLIAVFAIILFVSILISSQIFSFEKEKTMDIILHSLGEKKLRLIGLKKIGAVILYTTSLYIVCVIVISLIIFIFVGTLGWNTQIQVMPMFFSIPYNWTFGELYLHIIILAGICSITISMIGVLINSILQNTYTTIIITSIFVILPFILVKSVPMAISKVLDRLHLIGQFS